MEGFWRVNGGSQSGLCESQNKERQHITFCVVVDQHHQQNCVPEDPKMASLTHLINFYSLNNISGISV
jgi:hypothetical protein